MRPFPDLGSSSLTLKLVSSMSCDILSIEPFLANFIRVPNVLIVDLYIISDALRTDRIRHFNGRVRLSRQLLLQ